jgi:hypothetical protein
MLSGAACRGCGDVLIDGLGGWPPMLKMSDPERAEYEAADQRFRERHRDCRAHRWSMSGSRATHCGYCCPPPPLSPGQIERLRELFRLGPANERELDEWRLSLTCDHELVRRQHHSNRTWTTAVVECQDCGTRRGVVQAERIGPAVATAERQRLAAQLATATTAAARHHRAADRAEQLVAELTARIAAENGDQEGSGDAQT